MFKWLIGASMGFAGGYAVHRVMEARANGVPVGIAFANMGTAVRTLALTYGSGSAQPPPAAGSGQLPPRSDSGAGHF